MEAMINVGANAETVRAVNGGIMDILKASCDQSTKQKALDVLMESASVRHTTIRDCTFHNMEVKKKIKTKEKKTKITAH